MRLAALLAAVALAGCTSLPAARPIGGLWGGDHVGLEMGPTRGRLDYDCAAGTIDGPLATDSSGHFSAEGTHSRGIGGPVRLGEAPPSYPAHYWGSVDGDRMTLVVDVPGIGARIGVDV